MARRIRETKLGPGGYPIAVPEVVPIVVRQPDTRLGPGGYPVALAVPLIRGLAITGTVSSDQSQTSDSQGRVIVAAGAAPGPGREQTTWFYSVGGSAESGQSQSIQAIAEVVDPPAVKGKVSSKQRQVSDARADVVDTPITGVASSESGSTSFAEGIALAEVLVFTGQVDQSCGSTTRAEGIAEQWTEEEAVLIMLLAA